MVPEFENIFKSLTFKCYSHQALTTHSVKQQQKPLDVFISSTGNYLNGQYTTAHKIESKQQQ